MAPDSINATPAALVPDARLEESLRVTEIFHSLQGETSRVGLPTVFGAEITITAEATATAEKR